MVTNTGITLYNKIIDPITRNERLSRAFIPAVLYTETHGANILKSGMETADSAKIYVSFESLAQADKTGVDPKNYNDPETQFTFTRGAVVVKGEIVGNYQTIKQLETEFDHVHVITTVDIHDYGSGSLQHFEIGCK